MEGAVYNTVGGIQLILHSPPENFAEQVRIALHQILQKSCCLSYGKKTR
jgi:hypothetical protein